MITPFVLVQFLLYVTKIRHAIDKCIEIGTRIIKIWSCSTGNPMVLVCPPISRNMIQWFMIMLPSKRLRTRSFRGAYHFQKHQVVLRYLCLVYSNYIPHKLDGLHPENLVGVKFPGWMCSSHVNSTAKGTSIIG